MTILGENSFLYRPKVVNFGAYNKFNDWKFCNASQSNYFSF